MPFDAADIFDRLRLSPPQRKTGASARSTGRYSAPLLIAREREGFPCFPPHTCFLRTTRKTFGTRQAQRRTRNGLALEDGRNAVRRVVGTCPQRVGRPLAPAHLLQRTRPQQMDIPRRTVDKHTRRQRTVDENHGRRHTLKTAPACRVARLVHDSVAVARSTKAEITRTTSAPFL